MTHRRRTRVSWLLTAFAAAALSGIGAAPVAAQDPTWVRGRYVPPANNAEWQRIDPRAAGFDPVKLDSAIRFAKAREINMDRDMAAQMIEMMRFSEELGEICRNRIDESLDLQLSVGRLEIFPIFVE